jgi:hypothetical protein
MSLDEQQADISYGRLIDRPDEWEQFGFPTPGGEYRPIRHARRPFSVPSGAYDGEVLVTPAPPPRGRHLHTTDGTSLI